MHSTYTAPEEDMAQLQRERKTKLTLVVVGLIAAVIVMIGTSALMYSEDSPQQPQPGLQSR